MWLLYVNQLPGYHSGGYGYLARQKTSTECE